MIQRHDISLIAKLLSVLFFVFATATSAGQITFSDSDFDESKWGTSLNAVGGSSGSAATHIQSGNAFRRVTLNLPTISAALNAQIFHGNHFNPSQQGAVNNVSISYDARFMASNNPNETEIALGIALLQNGELHTAVGGSTTSNAFVNFSMDNIMALFPDIDWENGSTINFGFFNAASASVNAFSIDAAYDNFQVTLDFTPRVPTPATTSLFLIAALLSRRILK